ncbi:hypothetical protein CANARDRAFT_5111 [[Candida] arabinofermentans NRRL YB-2248]|uniref:Uncharacterized protein n=1 Tax=[Candida] arabinofermentans NRRL YB-2248 TaxID=983967 RepID=A0A1E4T817_9ASCO|nr:hypothetical protein CANARDRAFT_5111 [[Candida] arabinofermentans NRRL YB-2248]
MPPKIAGFYYDEEKKKYFKIITSGNVTGSSGSSKDLTKYTQSEQNKQHREEKENKLKIEHRPTYEQVSIYSLNPQLHNISTFLSCYECPNVSQFDYFTGIVTGKIPDSNTDLKLMRSKLQLHTLRHRHELRFGAESNDELSWVCNIGPEIFVGTKDRFMVLQQDQFGLRTAYYSDFQDLPVRKTESELTLITGLLQSTANALHIYKTNENITTIGLLANTNLIELNHTVQTTQFSEGVRRSVEENITSIYCAFPLYITVKELPNNKSVLHWYGSKQYKYKVDSQITSFDYLKARGGIIAAGSRNGSIIMISEKNITSETDGISHQFGAPICSVRFILDDDDCYLLVSGLKDTLILYRVQKDLTLVEVIRYQEYENRSRLERNLELHSSNKYFIVNNDKPKELKIYYLFQPKPLKLAQKLEFEGITSCYSRFCFVDDSVLICSGESLNVYN